MISVIAAFWFFATAASAQDSQKNAPQSCAAFVDQYFARRGYKSLDQTMRKSVEKATNTTSSPSGLPLISVDFLSADNSGWARISTRVTGSTTPLAGDPWHWDFSRYDEPFTTTFHFTSMGNECTLQSIEVLQRFKNGKNKRRDKEPIRSVITWQPVAKFTAPAGKILIPTEKDCGLILQAADRFGKSNDAKLLCTDAFVFVDAPVAAPVSAPQPKVDATRAL